MWWSVWGPFESVYAGDAALHSIYSHSHSGSLPVYSHSHSGSLAACLFSHQQTHRLPILTLSDSLPSILTLSGSLSIYSHTQVTVYLFSHPMLLRHSCSLAHQCIRALSGSLPMYSRTQTSHLSSPTPGYLVPTIRFAAYLASCAALPQPDSPLVYYHA